MNTIKAHCGFRQSDPPDFTLLLCCFCADRRRFFAVDPPCLREGDKGDPLSRNRRGENPGILFDVCSFGKIS